MSTAPDLIAESRAHQQAILFAEAANARDSAAVAALFTEDGIWELPGMTPASGRAAIAAAFDAVIAGFERLVQIPHPGFVEISAHGVIARHYVTEFATRGNGAVLLQAAVYHDILKPDAGWGFSSRKLHLLAKSHVANASVSPSDVGACHEL